MAEEFIPQTWAEAAPYAFPREYGWDPAVVDDGEPVRRYVHTASRRYVTIPLELFDQPIDQITTKTLLDFALHPYQHAQHLNFQQEPQS